MRIVVFSIPERGHINSTIGIIEKLLVDGHEIIYYIDKSFEKSIPSGCNIHYYSEKVKMSRCKNSINIMQLSQNIMMTTNEIMKYQYREIKMLYPDLVLHDMLCQWGKLIANILSIPGVCFIPTFTFSRDELSIINETEKKYITVKEWNPDLANSIISIKKDQDKRYGIQNLDYELSSIILESLTNYEKLNLVFTSRYLHPNSGNYNCAFNFVGPCFTMDERRTFEKDKLIYISFGTISPHREKLIEKLIHALGDSSYNVIISLGSSNIVIDNPYKNIQIFKYCNQREILSRACLYIGHASINSINEACFYNTPFIITALQREQFVIADRIRELRIAPVISAKRITKEGIKIKIDLVLKYGIYKNNFQLLCQSLKLAGGPVDAVRLIENYIKDS